MFVRVLASNNNMLSYTNSIPFAMHNLEPYVDKCIIVLDCSNKQVIGSVKKGFCDQMFVESGTDEGV